MSDLPKREILGRILNAKVGEDPTFQRAVIEVSERPRHEIVEQFADYAADYRAQIVKASLTDLPSALKEALDAKGNRRVIVPADLPAEWLPNGIEVTSDAQLSHAELDRFEAVVTGCAVGIAETGTIVLDAGIAQGRRALTLIPDHHLCVIFEEQVVDSVPEAVAVLESAVAHGRPLTWISGPSATSDIELSRVEGVHGPRTLDIFLISAD